MTDSFWLGMAVIFLSGTFNGSFALPMKYSRHWRWENTWLAFSLVAFVIFPWLLAGLFVPKLRVVYLGISQRALFYSLAFGFVLGVAQVTYGLCIKAVGIAVAIAVTSGVSCISGSLIPLLVLQPSDLLQPRGLLLFISMPFLFIGLALYCRAGCRREKEQVEPHSADSTAAWSFAAGLAICIFTGIFGSSINLGFAFSGRVIQKSLELGATPLTSTYAVWALLFGASFVPNFLYCSLLLFRGRGWSLFHGVDWTREALLAITMAMLTFAAFVGYGIGATLVGKYGTSLGWALFVAVSILSSSFSGILVGEWKSTSIRTRKLLAAAVGFMLVSVVVLNLGGIF